MLGSNNFFLIFSSNKSAKSWKYSKFDGKVQKCFRQVKFTFPTVSSLTDLSGTPVLLSSSFNSAVNGASLLLMLRHTGQKTGVIAGDSDDRRVRGRVVAVIVVNKVRWRRLLNEEVEHGAGLELVVVEVAAGAWQGRGRGRGRHTRRQGGGAVLGGECEEQGVGGWLGQVGRWVIAI